jgi:RimJ/RimL family protein N-acetyltransferase
MIAYGKYSPICLRSYIPLEAHQWRNDRRIWNWCRQYTLITAKEQSDWMNRIHTDDSIKMFSVCINDKCIGVAGFTSIDRHNRNAEFSLYIEPKSQGKGLGLNALGTLLHHGFYDWGFERIWGETYDGNPAIRMFKKLGMKTEGKLRHSYFRNGKFIDSYIVSVLREEWL